MVKSFAEFVRKNRLKTKEIPVKTVTTNQTENVQNEKFMTLRT